MVRMLLVGVVILDRVIQPRPRFTEEREQYITGMYLFF